MLPRWSDFWWSAGRRTTFVAFMLWIWATVAWNLVHVPDSVFLAVTLALLAIYFFALARMKSPKSPFSDNIAHASYPANVALKEIFISVGVALPFLLGLAWVAEQMGA